jgi:hypothetical protein
MLERFLGLADADRALRTLGKLSSHGIGRWALTGGLAVEIHRLLRGRHASARVLNDIDFVADSFDCIPESLADDFLFRHIHPADPPGRTMLQFIDPETVVRIDVFRASGATMDRTCNLDLPTGTLRLISLEDLVARSARLALDIAGGVPTPPKHGTDFLRLAELLDPAEAETAWRDHRKPKQPESFAEASRLLQRSIPTRENLQDTPEYSKDPREICLRCKATGAFRLADPELVLSLLGYC